MKSEILNNLRNTSKYIKYLIISKDKQSFGSPEVKLEDYDIDHRSGELIMALFNIKFSFYSEPELSDFIGELENLKNKLETHFSTFNIDKKGNVTNSKQNNLNFVGSFLIQKINFTYVDDEVEVVLDAMYHYI